MNATELVRQLNTLIAEHGDCRVTNEYDHEIDPPEFNQDAESCFLISFDEA